MKPLLILAAAASLMLAACSTPRHSGSATTDSSVPAATPATPRQGATPAERFSSMTAAYGLWQDVQMPVRATLRSPFSISASGRLTMVRDRLIHISMRVLGMEVAVMQVTPDSIFVADKFHRYLIAESSERLTASTGLTVGDMQSALLGRAFLPGRGPATASMAPLLTLENDGEVLRIGPAEAPAGYSWRMSATALDDGRIALSDMTVSVDGRKAPARAGFTPAPQLTAIGAVAEAVDLQATVAGKKIDARLTYSPDQARWNSGATPSLPTLRGYTRVSISTLLKSGLM